VDKFSTISTYLCKLISGGSNLGSYPHFVWISFPHYPHKQAVLAGYPHSVWKTYPHYPQNTACFVDKFSTLSTQASCYCIDTLQCYTFTQSANRNKYPVYIAQKCGNVDNYAKKFPPAIFGPKVIHRDVDNLSTHSKTCG